MIRFQRTLPWAVAGALLVASGCMVIHRPKASMENPRAVQQAVDDDFDKATAYVLQGDLRSALPILKALPTSSLSATRLRLRDGLLARFTGAGAEPAPTGVDAWTANVLLAYRSYWKQTMLGEQSQTLAESTLAKILAKLLNQPLDSLHPPDLDGLEQPLLTELERHGYHGLLGVTRPFRELLLWRGQTEARYQIDLPEGREQVTVVLLSDFASLGWLGFATLDVYHTGSWTKPDRLFCVAPAYDMGSESFRVSCLAHEGQHFRDNRLFPQLEQPELEYRAKLVEIALADQTLAALLGAFHVNQSADRDQPHAFANRRLMEGLSNLLPPKRAGAADGWAGLPPEEIRAAARRLLAQDTRALERR
jgi:hypothetical protein